MGSRAVLKRLVLGGIRRFVGRWGYEVRREPSLAEFLTSHGVDLVVDVGANVGQFGEELRRAGYAGRIVSFEPVSSAFARLSERVAADANWDAIHSAVGAECGTATINVGGDTVYSSIRKGSEFGERRDENQRPVRVEEVPLAPLDSFSQATTGERIFLKIDTQGYERQVLEGAKTVLDRAVGLQLELPIVHLYDGVWDFDEAVSHVRGLGFLPAQFRTVCTSPEFPASALEVDCVFRRDPGLPR